MNSKLIFVVDDDQMMLEMLKDHLEQNPMNIVKCFETGEQCIEHLGNNPHTIILDYQLNSIEANAQDGLAILKEVKNLNKDVNVIMLSSQEHYGKAAQTISNGAIQYVIKGDQAFHEIDQILEN